MKKLSKNFNDVEFLCPCCDKQEMDEYFIKELQKVRTSCDFGFKINSGWRCEKENTRVSKKSMGDHVRGLAVDVHINNRYKRALLLQYAINSRYFKDIAIGTTFIHLGKGRSKQGVGVYG